MKNFINDLLSAAVVAAIIGAPFALYFAFILEA